MLMQLVVSAHGIPVIRKIKFRGNQSFSDKVLEAQLLINNGTFPVVRGLKKDEYS